MTLEEAVTISYELVGQKMSDLALATVVNDLRSYPLPHVREALARVHRQGKRFAFVDILDQMPGGHPNGEEAWAIVAACLGNEDATVVWTDQMSGAFGVVRDMGDDQVAARMAFKEVYQRLVSNARDQGIGPQWRVSLGHDSRQREHVLIDAVQKQRISPDYALKFIVHDQDARLLLEKISTKLLENR